LILLIKIFREDKCNKRNVDRPLIKYSDSFIFTINCINNIDVIDTIDAKPMKTPDSGIGEQLLRFVIKLILNHNTNHSNNKPLSARI